VGRRTWYLESGIWNLASGIRTDGRIEHPASKIEYPGIDSELTSTYAMIIVKGNQ
jgi:hypothetical protein